ncbi:MAG: hypothetical protein NDJ89_08820 [Oligoflexia bacterium]|nr:hypothetical protein [Oligoflexia bacterium]
MKQLIVSVKTSTEVFEDFKTAMKKARAGQAGPEPVYEISFDSKKDFDRFLRHMYILSNILTFKPKSVYELAKLSGMDVSNLNKIILFFEEVGAVRIKKEKVDGREVKKPVVDYDRIQFKLGVA